MKSANYRSGKKSAIWMLLSFVVPFFIPFCFWSILAYADTSEGVERERTTGIKHYISEQEMIINSMRFGAEHAYQWGLCGLVLGSLTLLVHRKASKKNTSTEDA